MQNNRVIYLDMIKGISILLVVFCHYVFLPNETVAGNLLMCAAWGAVPCFFMVTGGIMHRSSRFSYKKHMIRTGRIYICLCIWKIIYLLWFSLLGNVSFSKTEFVQYIFLFGDIDGVSTGLMWFMYAYITAMLVFPITHFLFYGGKKGNILLLFSALLAFLNSIFIIDINFYFEILSKITGLGLMDISKLSSVLPFGSYCNMVFYFIVGAYLLKYHEFIREWFMKKRIRSVIPVACILIGIAGLMYLKYFYTGSFRWNGIYITNGYNRFATVLLAAGIYFIMMLLEKYHPVSRIFSWIGMRTMGIYYLHFPVLAFCIKYFNEFMLPYYSVLLNLAKSFLVVFVCVLISAVIKKIPYIQRLVE